MPTALILGHKGQDGTYLSRQLREDGYTVAGIDRGDEVDLTCRDAVHALLAETRADEIYHLAAYHHSSGRVDLDPGELVSTSLAVNTLSLNHVLSGVRRHSLASRVFYAASSRIFGAPADPVQNEETPFRPICPYGISKLAGVNLCAYYRDRCGIFACAGILYNHESPLRTPEFVSRKIVRAAARIARGLDRELELGDLSPRVDWGYAADYTRAMRMMLRLERPADFVIGSGVLHSVEDFVATAFGAVGLDWRDFVRENGALLDRARPAAVLCADSSSLRLATGWRPEVDFQQLVEIMIRAEKEADRG